MIGTGRSFLTSAKQLVNHSSRNLPYLVMPESCCRMFPFISSSADTTTSLASMPRRISALIGWMNPPNQCGRRIHAYVLMTNHAHLLPTSEQADAGGMLMKSK